MNPLRWPLSPFRSHLLPYCILSITVDRRFSMLPCPSLPVRSNPLSPSLPPSLPPALTLPSRQNIRYACACSHSGGHCKDARGTPGHARCGPRRLRHQRPAGIRTPPHRVERNLVALAQAFPHFTLRPPSSRLITLPVSPLKATSRASPLQGPFCTLIAVCHTGGRPPTHRLRCNHFGTTHARNLLGALCGQAGPR